MYVTCNLRDNEIKGYIQSNLGQKFKYEVAVVELFFEKAWRPSNGNFTIYHVPNKQIYTVGTFYFSQGLINVNGFVKDINKSIKDHFYARTMQIPDYNVEYDEVNNIIILDGNLNFKFHFDAEAINNFNLTKSYYQHVQLLIKPLMINEILNINSDIVSDHYFGLQKHPILRTFKIDPNQQGRVVYKNFEHPHYVDVNQAYFNYINVWLTDLNHKPILLPSVVLVKLHIRKK